MSWLISLVLYYILPRILLRDVHNDCKVSSLYQYSINNLILLHLDDKYVCVKWNLSVS